MGRSAAGEELAGAHAAGQSLEGCRIMRQKRKRGGDKEKEYFKSLFLCELNSTVSPICSTRCAAIKSQVNIFLVIMWERLCLGSKKMCSAAINTNTNKAHTLGKL